MKKSICFVCYANYCRSPAAQFILKNIASDQANVTSAGIYPIGIPGMDPRTQKYLDDNNYKFDIHNPTKISKTIINSNDLVYSFDIKTTLMLNKLFPGYSKKIKIITKNSTLFEIKDPYKFNEIDYTKVMCEIESAVKSIEL